MVITLIDADTRIRSFLFFLADEQASIRLQPPGSLRYGQNSELIFGFTKCILRRHTYHVTRFLSLYIMIVSYPSHCPISFLHLRIDLNSQYIVPFLFVITNDFCKVPTRVLWQKGMEQFECVLVARHKKRVCVRERDFYLSPDNPCLIHTDKYLSGAFWNILYVFCNYSLNCVERAYDPP